MGKEFKLYEDDVEVIEIARELGVELLRRSELTPEQRIHLKAAVDALDRMPNSTAGMCITFGLEYRAGEHGSAEYRFINFFIDEEEFNVTRGGSVYDKGYGSDTYSLPGRYLSIGGERETECEPYEVEAEIRTLIALGAVPSVSSVFTIDFDSLDES